MFTERTSVGLDVHARSVAAAAIDGVTSELMQAKLPVGNDRIIEWLRGLPAPVAVAYEAGPTAFGLYRALMGAGVRCEVAAPSKLQRPSGDRVKTDAKNAVHLARLLRPDEITPVAVPTVDQEAARDLVQAREDCRGDLMRARHRLSKLLLRHGIVYEGGAAWIGKHDQWLAQQHLANPEARVAFDAEYETVLQVKARRDRLNRSIADLADSEFTPVVHRLGCLREGERADRLRAGRRDRRLDTIHRQQHRLVRRIGAKRVLVRSISGLGPNHQDRQRARPPAAGRSGLALPPPVSCRRPHARAMGTRARRGQGTRRPREPAPT